MLFAGKSTNLNSRLEYLSADEVTPSIQENLDLPTLATDLSPYLNMSSSKVCLLKKEVGVTVGTAGGTGTPAVTNAISCVGFTMVKDIGGTGVTIDYTDATASAIMQVEKGKITLPGGFIYVLQLNAALRVNTYTASGGYSNINIQLALFDSLGPNYWNPLNDLNPDIAAYFSNYVSLEWGASSYAMRYPPFNTAIVDATAGDVEVGWFIRNNNQLNASSPNFISGNSGDTISTGNQSPSTQCLITQFSV